MAINSGFSHEKWWFSIAMLNYQRVSCFFWVAQLHTQSSDPSFGSENTPQISWWMIPPIHPFPHWLPCQIPRKSLDRNLCGLVSGTLARGNNPTCQSCWWKMFHHLPKKWPKCRHIKPNNIQYIYIYIYMYIYIMIPWHGASGTSSSEFRTPPKKRVLKVNKKPAVNASTVPRPAFRFRSAVTQDWFASENSPSDWEVVKRPGVWRGTQKWASYDFTHANGVFFDLHGDFSL